MSPVDPISPTSPMNISPISPTPMEYHFDMPSSPLLTPTVHLPRLVTSFQNTGTNQKRMSMQFHLPTPSPLSLSQTPMTAIRRASAPQHKRSNANASLSPMELLTATTLASLPSPRTPRQDGEFAGTPTLRHVPSLQRQNAMERLDLMESSLVEQVISLPLRTTRRPSEAARETSLSTQAVPEDSLSISFSSTRTSHRNLSNRHQRQSSASSTNSSRVRPRSPIHKSHRRSHSSSQRRYFDGLLTHLRNELVPLISVRTGKSHPGFPRSILQYQLLTHDELDDLARHYHQTLDAGEERWLYPCPIGHGKAWCGNVKASDLSGGRRLVDLQTKRRRWGRFIGLKNCESPTADDQEANLREIGESMRERMERQWRESLRRQEEEYKMREKIVRGNF